MKKLNRLMSKFLIVLLLFPLFSTQTVHATPGRLRAASIKNISGIYYGQHGSDDHWHKATKKNGVWYASGPEIR